MTESLKERETEVDRWKDGETHWNKQAIGLHEEKKKKTSSCVINGITLPNISSHRTDNSLYINYGSQEFNGIQRKKISVCSESRKEHINNLFG